MKALLAALFAVAALAIAGEGPAATRPSLRPAAFAPLTIVGQGFVPGERVTVTVYAGASRTVKAVAGPTGRFRARFSFAQARCTAWLVRATSSSGMRTAYRVSPSRCDPPVAAGSVPPAGRTGIAGVIRRGPITPVCVAEQPCDGPAAGVGVDVEQGNVVIAHTATGPDGRFYVLAAAGDYVVRANGRGLSPRPTHVQSGRFVEVDFSIDTGIR
jgi:hypothetical protein